MELPIKRLVFKDLPIEIDYGKPRGKKYYKEHESKFPPSIRNNIDVLYEYKYDKKTGKHFLVHIDQDKPVLQNYKTANQPSTVPINAQLSNSQNMTNYYKIIKIKQHLKYFFLSNLKGGFFINNKPLYIEFVYVLKEFNKERDLDNFKGFYEKVFLDCIQKKRFNGKNELVDNPLGIIDNDKIEFVNKLSHELIIDSEIPTNLLIINFYENKNILSYNHTKFIEHDNR